MKKYLICLLLLFTSCSHLETKDDDLKYLKEYEKYSNFVIEHYEEYESLRTSFGFSFLEAINYYNFPQYFSLNEKIYSSIFKNKPYVLVNKCFFLNKDDVPNDLIKVSDYKISYIKRENEVMMASKLCLDNYYRMYCDFTNLGYDLYIFSGYRTYEKQESLYINGEKEYVASPGTSEHQSGYALDISSLEFGLSEFFEESEEFKWLYQNSYKYGFILRYPKNQEHITGYLYEPWHFRYVGNIALEIKNDTTLEQYLFSNQELSK